MKKDNKPKGTTRVADVVLSAMKKKNLGISDLAETVDYSYERVRRVVKGMDNPGRFLLKAITDALDLDYDEMQRLQAADDIQRRHGSIPLEMSGKNVELEPIDRAWKFLSQQHKDDLVAMARTFANIDKDSSEHRTDKR